MQTFFKCFFVDEFFLLWKNVFSTWNIRSIALQNNHLINDNILFPIDYVRSDREKEKSRR